MLDIAQHQVNVLRSRQAISYVISKGQGLYFKIGYTAENVAELLGISTAKAQGIVGSHLSQADAAKVRDYPTTLNSPTPQDYDLIFRHGYENAKCVHRLLGM